MDVVEYRAIVRFLVNENETTQNIHRRLKRVYKTSSPSFSTITAWIKEFKRGPIHTLSVGKKKECAKSRQEWSRRETNLLIATYKNYPRLWNYKRFPDVDKIERSRMYQEIATQFETFGQDIQRKLHNLRSQWTAEAKKVRERNGGLPLGQGVYVSTWYAFNKLRFLDEETMEGPPQYIKQEPIVDINLSTTTNYQEVSDVTIKLEDSEVVEAGELEWQQLKIEKCEPGNFKAKKTKDLQ